MRCWLCKETKAKREKLFLAFCLGKQEFLKKHPFKFYVFCRTNCLTFIRYIYRSNGQYIYTKLIQNYYYIITKFCIFYYLQLAIFTVLSETLQSKLIKYWFKKICLESKCTNILRYIYVDNVFYSYKRKLYWNWIMPH